MSYAYIFLQSCALEMPIYLALANRTPRWQMALGIFAMNSVTHPVVFFGIMNLPLTFLHTILLAEAFAVVTEALVLTRFARLNLRRAMTASVVANLFSWQFGPVLTYLFWG